MIHATDAATFSGNFRPSPSKIPRRSTLIQHNTARGILVVHIFTLALALAVLPHSGYCRSIVPRELAQKHIEETLTEIRANMDSNPGIVEDRFTDGLADVLDDPRVRQVAVEVIARSHSPRSVRSAVGALGGIISECMPAFGRSKWKRSMADDLEPALRNTDADVRLYSASVLASLGGTYEDRGYAMLSAELRSANRTVALRYLLPRFANHPEVVDTVIAEVKDNSDGAADRGLQHIGYIVGENSVHAILAPRELREITACLKVVASSGNVLRGLKAAQLLEQAGHKADAYTAYRALVATPIAAQDAATKSEAIYVVLTKLLNNGAAQNRDALRAAEANNGLLTTYAKQVDDDLQTGANKQFELSQVAKWKGAME